MRRLKALVGWLRRAGGLVGIVRQLYRAAIEREQAMATVAATKPAPDTGVGKTGVSSPWVVIVSILFIIETLVLLYAVMAFWPPAKIADNVEPVFFGATIPMSREQNLLLLMALLGALGAMAHIIRSYFKYVGERNLIWSWMPQYFLIPFVGAILATITYILLRAGLIGGSSSGAIPEGNTWGFAAVATLVGLFSAQAAAKLKDIFEIVLAPAKPGGETAGTSPAQPPTLVTTSAAAGADIVITGDGLETAKVVTFTGGATAPATWDEGKWQVTATVPEDAKSGALTVKVETGDVPVSGDFTLA
jgi:hypothetical protein